MGAKNYGSVGTTGRVNYYGVSYGALSTRVKEIPEGYTEIKQDELKSLSTKKEEIDLRQKYVLKTGDYPYSVFYQAIEGTVLGMVTKQPQGMSKMLELEILDSDGDTSLVSMNLYSKYSETLLNRLASLNEVNSKQLLLSPYSIPNTFPGLDGKNITMYNQGFSVKSEGVKVGVAYDKDSKDLPPTEKLQDAQGNDTTSRVKRVNFLFEKASAKFTARQDVKADVDENESDELPF